MPCFYKVNSRTVPFLVITLPYPSLRGSASDCGNLSDNTTQQDGESPTRESKLKKAVPCAMIERNRVFPGSSRRRTAP